jgi:hypothetical protein
VVDRDQVTDDRQHGIGPAPIIIRHILQPLDLTHHVVGEVADNSGVQWEIVVDR